MRNVHYLIVLLTFSLASGQTALELYGFGMPQSEGDAISAAAGGVTVLSTDANRHAFASTATWYKARGTQLSAILGSQASIIGDGKNLWRSGLYAVQFLAHLSTKSAWGMYIKPSTRINYYSSTSDSIQFPLGEVLQYSATGQVRGGITKFAVGYSRRLGGKISIGVSGQFLFGAISRLDTMMFTDLGTRTDISSRLIAQQRTEFSGQTVAINILYSKLPVTNGELGFSLELPISLDAYQVQRNPLVAEFPGVHYEKIGYPLTIKIGYAHPLRVDQRLVAEYSNSRLPDDNQNDLLFNRYIDHQSTVRVGWSRFRREREESVLGRFDYRVGFYNTKYYLSPRIGGNLDERALSLGMGYIFNRSGQRLDFTFVAGDRSELLPELQGEIFYRITLGISTSEVWFNRPKKIWD